MTDTLTYMKTRRSSLSVSLEAPGPDDATIEEIVRIATRVPDHGKLAPWRLVLWTMPARQSMHGQLRDLLKVMNVPDANKKAQGTDKLLHAPCVLAVISTARDSEKVPRWEQELSAGAVCMNTLIAANAAGFEAQWLTAWYVYEERANAILNLEPGERVAGIIHIGSSTTPKNERPRPALADVFSVREG